MSKMCRPKTQESKQSLSAKINGKTEEWSENQLEQFWKKTFTSCMNEASPNSTTDYTNRKIIAAL